MRCNTSLIDVIRERKDVPGRGITFIEGSSTTEFLSYNKLYYDAVQALAMLQKKGLQPGDELVIQTESNKTFIIIFWACVLGGIIPIPLATGRTDDHRRKLFNVWSALKHPCLFTSFNNLARIGAFAVTNGREGLFSQMQNGMIDENSPWVETHAADLFTAADDDIAFVQFSSGSTGNAKGVVLTHRNLITNIKAIASAACYSQADASLSWMPLTHDMGLIGFHLSPLYSGMNQYLIPTSVFIRKPTLWLEKASEYKTTVICSPNFGYRYLIKHLDAGLSYAWDLSAVRILYNGAEPISVRLCKEFLSLFSKWGLKKNSMCPVYGLAEGTLAVSMSDCEQEVMSIALDRSNLGIGCIIREITRNGVSFVNVGQAVDDCSIRITDHNDRVLPHETIGHVQIQGNSICAGYYNDHEETANVFTHDRWLRTGDVGFMKDGCLYITGRAKDIIFFNGQNYYPHDLERIAEEQEGIELNKIAMAAFFDEVTQKEKIITFVLYRGNIENFVSLAAGLRSLITRETGVEIDEVIPVQEIPKTTSGKLQRFKLIEQYKQGHFNNVKDQLQRSMQAPVKEDQSENGDEDKLLQQLKRILNRDNINPDHYVFELGLSSLKGAELQMYVLKEWKVELPTDLLYANPTIRELMASIKTLHKGSYAPVPAIAPGLWHPVSAMQRMLYYFQRTHPATVAYNIPLAFTINGDVNANRLIECLNVLVQRHDALRMTFHLADEPRIKVNENIPIDCTEMESEKGELPLLLKGLVQPFDLDKGPLFRIRVITVNRDEKILFVDFHHIITDGVSISYFLTELIDLYKGGKLPVIGATYKDYIYFERNNSKADRVKRQEAWWLSQLADELPVLQMPADFPRPPVFNTAGEKIPFVFDPVATTLLKEFARANHTTLHTVLFTLYAVLLSKLTEQENIIIGIPVAGRRHPDLQFVHGLFVNNLPVRNVVTGDQSFTGLLNRVKEQLGNAFNNQDYCFGDLVQQVTNKRDASRNLLFDTMFLYQDMEWLPSFDRGISLHRYFFDPGFSKFDISLEIFEADGQLKCNFEYATSLFKRSTILRLVNQFTLLVDRILHKPHGRLVSMSLLTDEEYHDYIWKFNDSEKAYPVEQTIHQLFEQQVQCTPERVAIEYKEQQITYQQLNEQANSLAVLLREKGVVPNIVTGLLLNRSPALIVSILAILKAGGCYLPIEPDLPVERINLLIADSHCNTIITASDLVQKIQLPSNAKTKLIMINEPGILQTHPASLTHLGDSGNLAYIIYTSGTTGKPKGVMISHQSLVNYTWWAAKNYIKEEQATFPLFTSVSFDLTVTSIFTPLITGNRIVIYDQEEQEQMIETIVMENKVTIVKLTPSHLALIKQYRSAIQHTKSNIKRFIVGGEELPASLAREIVDLFGADIGIYNEYGPTEATVGCMIHQFNPEKDLVKVPIGVPAQNTQLYVLDKYLQPVSQGVHGELYISGDSVAKGYLFNDELTRLKFIPNPFIEGKKMYRTGDIVKRLEDGNLEYIGRVDRQVKINGYRIELNEIENCVRTYPTITDAVVAVRSINNKLCIITWYTANTDIELYDIINYLALRLPYYMIPVHFCRIAQIPLTKNGKVDPDTLPQPAIYRKAGKDLSGNSKTEKILMEVWCELFDNHEITVDDNFFDLGGDSIRAVQIASRVFEYGIIVKPKDILTYHTIEQVARHVKLTEAGDNHNQRIIEGERKLMPIEKWFFEKQFKNPGYYTQSVLLQLNKQLHIQWLETIFQMLIMHHDGLRINYDPDKKILFYHNQFLDKKFSIEQYEIEPDLSFDDRLPAIAHQIKCSFDITNDILLKAALIKHGSDHRLFITAHHLVIDGISWRILLTDLYTAYHMIENGQPVHLPLKTASLQDYAEKLYGKTNWKNEPQEPFRLPYDFETNEFTTGHLDRIEKTLDKVSTTLLVAEAHHAYKTDVPILLNTALLLALHEWTGHDSFIIVQESHGRDSDLADVSRTIGWFTILYPLKLVYKAGSLSDHIKSVKEQMRTYKKQPVGSYPTLMSELRFNYLGQFGQELDNDLFTYSHSSTGTESGPENALTANIDINAMILAGELYVMIDYNSTSYKKATMQFFADVFIQHLENILHYLKNEEDIHLTPSDFDTVDLNQEELDSLFS